MAWVRVDDHYDEHPKFGKAGPLGMAMWLAGLAYCNRNLTDGFIPWSKARALLSWEFLGTETNERGEHIVYTIAVTSGMSGDDVTCEFVIDQLKHAGLWEEVDGGYRVHDYLNYQPSKQQVEDEHAKKRAAGQAGGQASAQARASAGGQAESNPKPKPNPSIEIEPTSLSLARGARTPKRPGVDDEYIETLVAEFWERFGSEDAVRDSIAAAMNHKAQAKAIDKRLYVRRWLAKDLSFSASRTSYSNGTGRGVSHV